MQQTIAKTTESSRITVSGRYQGGLSFVPKRAFFEQDALEYPIGKRVFKILKELGSEINLTRSHNRITGIPGSTPAEAYFEGKRTLVVGVRRTMEFQTCKPSAHFQLPLVTSCPGMCEYCYLNTTLGKKPYIRVYVNIDEILTQTKRYIDDRLSEKTVFEGAATSDPLPVEPFTGTLARVIDFFGTQEHGRFRFVTKFCNVDSLLKIQHRGHTRFRFSINAHSVIKNFERGTPGLSGRLEAAVKVHGAGYPLGFIIGPIIIFEGWEEEYRDMLAQLKKMFGTGENITLELITHRFTKKAKSNILEVFPATTLPMTEKDRKYKYGQFGYGKYVYQQETMGQIKTFMSEIIAQSIPLAETEYFI